MSDIPSIRITCLNNLPDEPRNNFVLYWMLSARRLRWNFALQQAVKHARRLKKPLLVVEELPCGVPWASDRTHQFLHEGMRENASVCKEYNIAYAPFISTPTSESRALRQSLFNQACVVITDEFPCYIMPALVADTAKDINIRLEQVDGNGLLPLQATKKLFLTAYDFRRFLQKKLEQYLLQVPVENPLASLHLRELESLPPELPISVDEIDISQLPLDHSVPPSPIHGGSEAAEKKLEEFLNLHLAEYIEIHKHPDFDATSGLSPYLHTGHISVHQIFHEIIGREGWDPEYLGDSTIGSRSGWWGLSENTESFIDELITWREVGYNMTHLRPDDYDKYESLPDWAKKTLETHAHDPRPILYTVEQIETANTHDELWNAAQRQLLTEGRIHNYLRMLWGKKILEWTSSPQEALEIMLELNNKYALDGCNPNSYTGIFWILGRYDRAWGPERPIYGKIRYMSSNNAARKCKLKKYVKRYMN